MNLSESVSYENLRHLMPWNEFFKVGMLFLTCLSTSGVMWADEKVQQK